LSIIGSTVREAQELLCKCLFCSSHRYNLDLATLFPRYTGSPYPISHATKYVICEYPISPPQSLGELCIELAQKQVYCPSFYHYKGQKIRIGFEYLDFIRRDIQELRTKMYHKHTDPIREQFEQARDYFSNLSATPWPGTT